MVKYLDANGNEVNVSGGPIGNALSELQDRVAALDTVENVPITLDSSIVISGVIQCKKCGHVVYVDVIDVTIPFDKLGSNVQFGQGFPTPAVNHRYPVYPVSYYAGNGAFMGTVNIDQYGVIDTAWGANSYGFTGGHNPNVSLAGSFTYICV